MKKIGLKHRFSIKNDFNHGRYVQDITKFTSSNNCLQLTDGKLIIVDKKKELIFTVMKKENPVVGLIEYENLQEAAFYMFGTIEEAIEKAEKMKKDAAA